MTQPIGPPTPYPQQPTPDEGKKFLNMSAGVLALVIAGVVLLCCVGPAVLCLVGGVVGAVSPVPTPTPSY